MEIFEKLTAVIHDRKENPVAGSYTTSLFEAGENKIVKKLGEENAEYIRAFVSKDMDGLAGEAADYIYHLMVSLEYLGISFADVAKVLSERYK
jgi:phosphoribosyl-ATP pyrophosphohydrolase/phosphoribosyl-ATP pyrophosphohydrolase/phosphoribosyl-AMP cyclohydrolase